MITDRFKKCVADKEMQSVYIMLKGSLVVDKTFSNFKELEDYASARIPNLYLKHNGEELKYNTSDWTENYLSLQLVRVVDNFSKERIELIKRMMTHIYGNSKEEIKYSSTQTKFKKKNTSPNSTLSLGLMALGGVLSIVGIFSSKILLLPGIGLIGAGYYMIRSDR